MAILSSRQNGNFTAASTWAVVDNASYNTTETSTNAVLASFTAGLPFTPAAGTYVGMAVRVLQTATVPVGTFSGRLEIGGVPIAGTTVTINVSDMSNGTNSMAGWVYLKFAAPVVLAAVSTNLALQCSTSSQVTCFTSSAFTWNRMLVTNTTAAPIAGDTINVVGEYLSAGVSNSVEVTMNNTAIVDFSTTNVGGKGILTFATAPSTNYTLRVAAEMFVTGQGTLNIGTLATPMPATSTGILRFVNAVNVDRGLQIRGTAKVTTYGAEKIGRTYLQATASAGDTSITTQIVTGWLSGDLIALASTTTTAAQTEVTSLTANAVGTTVNVGALAFAHSGATVTRGEIINLTRNVQIVGTSTTLQTYVTNIQGAFAAVSFNYTDFRFMGSNTTNRRGVDINTTGIGSFVMNGCALRNFEVASSQGIVFGGNITNVTISDCVFYRISTQAIAGSSTAQASVSIINCWAFVNIVATSTLISYGSPLPTMSGIVAVSSTGVGFNISVTNIASGVIDNITAHSNGGNGVALVISSNASTPPVISNITSWRNTGNNITINSCFNIVIDTVLTFSATAANINFVSGASADVQLRNVICNGGVTPTAASGVLLSVSMDRISFVNSDFSTATPHTTSDFTTVVQRGFIGINLYNCFLGATNEVTSLNLATYNSYITSSRHDGISGAFKTFTPLGIITKDYVIFDATNLGLSASTRMAPTTNASKISTDKIIAVPSGRRLKITVGVRRSVIGDGATHNGALPELLVKKNHSLGLITDTVLATATVASNGAFEFISGTTPVATDNGAFTFCVTTNGTAGFVNVDSFVVEVI